MSGTPWTRYSAFASDSICRCAEPRIEAGGSRYDTFTVLGPYLVTADEITDPSNLDLSIDVNGEKRQGSNTRALIFDIPRLIAYASAGYRLYPGDVIMTGTPEGVGPVKVGDVMTSTVTGLGRMVTPVRA